MDTKIHFRGKFDKKISFAVEKVSNHKFLLGHSQFDYVEALLNHKFTSSTAK